MRKIIIILIVLCMVFMLSACVTEDLENPCIEAECCDAHIGDGTCHCHGHCGTDGCECHSSHG